VVFLLILTAAQINAKMCGCDGCQTKKTSAWFGDSVVGNYRGGHDPVGVPSQPIKFSSTASDQTCAGSKVPLEFISSKKDTRALEKNIVNIFFQRAEHGLNF
jgi:hypothetical protein